MNNAGTVTKVHIGPERLAGLLGAPDQEPVGLVIFAHGSGSGRMSPRNQHVATELREAGLATLLLDLLTSTEEQNRANVFDIGLLAKRLLSATRWAREDSNLSELPIGYFGASTGAGAALVAAAEAGDNVSAVVSRGGRPDMAGDALEHVRAPTLLIVGGADTPVITLNQEALDRLRTTKSLVIVPGATHLFEEPGTLDDVVNLARQWFLDFLPDLPKQAIASGRFADRRQAGRRLASALRRFREEDPLILALPRGGVPVAFEVAQALDAELDIVLVRKIGAPGHAEYGIGALVEGPEPLLVLNEQIVQMIGPPPGYIEGEKQRQLKEIERRRDVYRHGRAPIPVSERTVIVVDDGIATGGTMRAVLQALRQEGAAHTILAVPVAPADTLAELSELADETVCLATPDPFRAVGLHYHDFDQTTDEEVIELLEGSRNGGGRPPAGATGHGAHWTRR
jgi:putative phosphoribosyl transferase